MVKKKQLWLSGHQLRRPAQLLERVPYPASLHQEESVFGQLSEPHLYPEVFQVRENLRDWRFYHEFAVWPGCALRAPQVGIRSSILVHDGSKLAVGFETIRERGHTELLFSTFERAFPGSHESVKAQSGRFQMPMQREGILRPPAFRVLNVPENSLHPDLLPALAQLMA